MKQKLLLLIILPSLIILFSSKVLAQKKGNAGAKVTEGMDFKCPKIVHLTEAIGLPKTRTKIGIREDVELKLNKRGRRGVASWNIINGGLGEFIGGYIAGDDTPDPVVFRANGRAGIVTIEATPANGCGTKRVTFTVVEPNGVLQSVVDCEHFNSNVNPNAGMVTKVFILPNDVSFESYSQLQAKINFAEVNLQLTGATGSFDCQNNDYHCPNGCSQLAGKGIYKDAAGNVLGTELFNTDAVYHISCDPLPNVRAGNAIIDIPNTFTALDLTTGVNLAVQFAVVRQSAQITATGQISISKAGANHITNPGDPHHTCCKIFRAPGCN